MTFDILRKMDKRIALYVRVSTVGKGQDVNTQLIPLRDWARFKGAHIYKEYIDVGISGSRERRPGLDHLMADARKGKFDVVLVARFDRFARSVRHLLQALAEFETLKIDFISLSESVDTTTPMGRMVFTVLGAVAELERNLIIERVNMGLDRARREGKRLGRPPMCMYDKGRLIDLIESGRSVRSVAYELGISRPTVDKVMREHRAGKAVLPPLQQSSVQAVT